MDDFGKTVINFAKGYAIGYLATKGIQALMNNQSQKMYRPYADNYDKPVQTARYNGNITNSQKMNSDDIYGSFF